MNKIPILGFSGYSNSGKTTLIEKLIVSLKFKGLHVAVIKHHAHENLEADKPGKDSWKFTQAGADISIVSSLNKTAFIEQRSLEFQQLVSMVHDVDLILVEGFKREPIMRIGVCRKQVHDEFPDELHRYLAVVTDKDELQTEIPKFNFEQIEQLSNFVLQALEDGRLMERGI